MSSPRIYEIFGCFFAETLKLSIPFMTQLTRPNRHRFPIHLRRTRQTSVRDPQSRTKTETR
jgi:hypothetical protein